MSYSATKWEQYLPMLKVTSKLPASLPACQISKRSLHESQLFYGKNNLCIYGLDNSLHINRTDFQSNYKYTKMKAVSQPASQGKVLKYTILEHSYYEEQSLTFTPQPDPLDMLTEANYKKIIFDKAVKDFRSQKKQVRQNVMVTMRQIAGLSSVREEKYVRDYMNYCVFGKCFQEMSGNLSQSLKYEACFILDNLANDFNYCYFLIAKKEGIQQLLQFIGRQKCVQIRNKAISALRKAIDQICFHQPHQQYEELIDNILHIAMDKLKSARKRIQVRQIARIIQRVYKSGVGPRSESRIQKAYTILCEVIRQDLIKPVEKQELGYVLSGFQKYFVYLIRVHYKILGKLMKYAKTEEQYSEPAMDILEHVAFSSVKQELSEQPVFAKEFFEFALSLVKKQKRSWPKIQAICRTLRSLAGHKQFIKIFVQNSQLLRILKNIPELKDQQLSVYQKYNYVLCEMYQAMGNNTDSFHYVEQLIDLIKAQNVPQTTIQLITPDTNNETVYLGRGLRIIQKMLNFGRRSQKDNQIILGIYLKLGIVQRLKQILDHPNPDLDPQIRDIAEKIKIVYCPKEEINKQQNQPVMESKGNKEINEGGQNIQQ